MSNPYKYVVAEHQVGVVVKYSVNDESEPEGEQFVAQFKHQPDAFYFILMMQEREAKAREALNHGTLDELAARFPEDFGLKD